MCSEWKWRTLALHQHRETSRMPVKPVKNRTGSLPRDATVMDTLQIWRRKARVAAIMSLLCAADYTGCRIQAENISSETKTLHIFRYEFCLWNALDDINDQRNFNKAEVEIDARDLPLN